MGMVSTFTPSSFTLYPSSHSTGCSPSGQARSSIGSPLPAESFRASPSALLCDNDIQHLKHHLLLLHLYQRCLQGCFSHSFSSLLTLMDSVLTFPFPRGIAILAEGLSCALWQFHRSHRNHLWPAQSSAGVIPQSPPVRSYIPVPILQVFITSCVLTWSQLYLILVCSPKGVVD